MHGDLEPLTLHRRLEVVSITAIVAVAAALRLWALDHQPGGLYPDEAAEAYDAHRLLTEPGFHPVFFQDDAGREALYGYLVAIAFRVAGESTTVLRATSAVLGILAVVALYLWLRPRGATVALSAAAWAAGSLWLVCISRDGMRNVLVPVTAALALWALCAWAGRPGRNRAILAGGAMGLGLWTYQPLKLFPLLLVAWLLWLRHRDHLRWGALRPWLGWLVLAYVVVGAPMLFTAVTDPGHYFGRAVAVTAGGQAAAGSNLLDHTVRTLLMFAFTGDPNQRHNVDGLPLLGIPMSLLAALGLWAAWRRRGEALESLVLIAIPVFLIPPLVATADAAPHFLRSLGLAAPAAALVGMGAAEAVRLGRRVAPTPVLAAPVVLAILAGAGGSASAYFRRPVSARYEAYSFVLVDLAGAARTSAHSIVLLDAYRAPDIQFLDSREVAAGTVRIVDPGLPASSRASCAGQTVWALDVEDIRRVYGTAAATRAMFVYGLRDPLHNPAIWVVDC